MPQSTASPGVQWLASPSLAKGGRQTQYAVVTAIMAMVLVCVGLYFRPDEPLFRMEQFRQRAEDSLSSVDWPDNIIPILRAWERDSLNVADPLLRSNLLSEIRLMTEKSQMLAKPAVKQSLQLLADELAKARDRSTNAQK